MNTHQNSQEPMGENKSIHLGISHMDMITHELKTPLSTIIGWCQLLAMSPNVDAVKWHDALQKIHKQARVQEEMLSNLHDFFSIKEGVIKPSPATINLSEAISSISHKFDAEIQSGLVTFSIDDINKPHLTQADATLLERILKILISNAIRFTREAREGGRISIKLNSPDKNVCSIEIKDNGIGISKEDLEPIFTAESRFSRKKRPGTGPGLGVGLYIASSLARLQGGTLTAQSDGPNTGATFTLKLPRASAS